ncbi:hypothetical protein [Schleiferilactobacillus harbinensis]|uniref:hypothetical protein n=1 Tax=Schleiferilactobacillus harbinensis TaxID=304207 RepID=UPI00345EA6FD
MKPILDKMSDDPMALEVWAWVYHDRDGHLQYHANRQPRPVFYRSRKAAVQHGRHDGVLVHFVAKDIQEEIKDEN